MTKPITDRIAALKERQEKIGARLINLEAKAKQQDRKRETRRKIVVGGAILVAMEKDPAFAHHVKGLLAQQVGRPIDRDAIADLLTPSPAPTGPAFTVRYRQAGPAPVASASVGNTKPDAR